MNYLHMSFKKKQKANSKIYNSLTFFKNERELRSNKYIFVYVWSESF